MTVTVTINAASTAELHAEMNALLAGVGSPLVQTKPTPTGTAIEIVQQAVAVQNAEAAVSEAPEPEKKERKPRAKKAEAAPVVVPETPAEVKAQDEADEAAEAEVTQPKTEYTRDHVRAALGKYVQKFGAVAVETDAPALFKLVFPNETVSRISEIPETQEALGKAVAGVGEMLAKNPFKRTPVGE